MKLFEKVLLGFLILIFIGSFLIPIFIGTFSFYTFLDASTNTLLWAIPCLFIWVIVKIFIYFTKEKEKTEEKDKTKKTERKENKSKKLITLVLIFLIVINTIFWLNITFKTFEGSKKAITKISDRARKESGMKRIKLPWKLYKTGAVLSKEEEEEKKAHDRYWEIVRAGENTLTYRMIKTFEGSEFMLITFLIITDVVLIAIYFMMIPSYKERTIEDKK